jgi:ATP-dependent DNA helicase Rep
MLLNPQQLAAVRYLDGPLLVLAGAGSGKTRVITEKIAYLVQQCGYAPHSVYAVTFTNKAAKEMQSRAKILLPAHVRRGLKVSTFHTLGLNMLKKDPVICGLKPGFSILDAEDTANLIRGLVGTTHALSKDDLRQIQAYFSAWKNGVANFFLTEQLTDLASALYPRYIQTLRAYNAVDFDDLIMLPVQAFHESETFLSYWQNKIHYLLVDEYQDANTSQYEFVKLLMARRPQFTVVGDDDQSIYAWRGARPENLKQLQQDYPKLKVIKLEQNYRSAGRILMLANQLISNNPHVFSKTLWSTMGPGDLIRVIRCRDEQDEAEQVIADLVSTKLRSRANFSDFAILYRGNHQARLFETVLRQQGIPYHLSGGQSWFARTEIKDIFAYLRLLCNESDDQAFLRVINTPRRGIGETSLLALTDYARERQLSLYACADHLALQTLMTDAPRQALQQFKMLVEHVKQRCLSDSTNTISYLRQWIDEIGYETYLYEQSETPVQAQKRMDQVFELLEWVQQLMLKPDIDTLSDVVARMVLIDRLETQEEGLDAVKLMTLHASKGLEFPFVYLAGLEEGLLPHRVSIENETIEEERRLAYVGITRAQKSLSLTFSAKRRSGGNTEDTVPSRFLDELPEEHLVWFGQDTNRNSQSSTDLAKSHLSDLKRLLGHLEV